MPRGVLCSEAGCRCRCPCCAAALRLLPLQAGHSLLLWVLRLSLPWLRGALFLGWWRRSCAHSNLELQERGLPCAISRERASGKGGDAVIRLERSCWIHLRSLPCSHSGVNGAQGRSREGLSKTTLHTQPDGRLTRPQGAWARRQPGGS